MRLNLVTLTIEKGEEIEVKEFVVKNIIRAIFAAGTLCFGGLLALTPIQSASALSPGMASVSQMLGGVAEQLPIENVQNRVRRNRGGSNRNRARRNRGGANRNRARRNRGGANRNRARNRHSYNRHRHGRRYRGRRGNYRHYYRGYWYANPWWIVGTAAAIGAGAAYAGSRCERISDLCAANWGRGGPDYWGCMRYEGCN